MKTLILKLFMMALVIGCGQVLAIGFVSPAYADELADEVSQAGLLGVLNSDDDGNGKTVAEEAFETLGIPYDDENTPEEQQESNAIEDMIIEIVKAGNADQVNKRLAKAIVKILREESPSNGPYDPIGSDEDDSDKGNQDEAKKRIKNVKLRSRK